MTRPNPGPPGAPTDSSHQPHLILASASPRRFDLLRAAGYRFITHPSDIDESDYPSSLSPAQLAQNLAERKARTIAAAFPDCVVLGADTVVATAHHILGKPLDRDDARRILALLSGTAHSVITGVAVIRLHPPFFQAATVCSTVQMRALSNDEREAYLSTNQWQGKAGAYGIQDNDPFVCAIAGCTTNIVGLPMTTTRTLLAQAGIHPDCDSPTA